MFNSAAKLQFGLAAFALVLAVIYGLAIEDPTGFVLMLGAFLAFTLAALAVTGSGVKDRAPAYLSMEDAPPVQTVVVDRSLGSRPSPWPLVASVAVCIFAVGVAVDHTVVIAGLIAGLIAAAGWLAQCWREDPSYTTREGERVSQRLLTPFGLPVLALALVGIIVFSISRVLLAVPKEASLLVAFGAAILILVTFFILSARPHTGRGPLYLMAGFALISVVVAGGVTAATGYRKFENKNTGPPAQFETAQNTSYQNKALTVTAGQVARITFTNLDTGVLHNIAVYTSNPGGTPIWTGAPIRGNRQITYQTVFQKAGTFAFRCDFHPTAMTGTFTVVNP
jgi:plastocyanin